MKILIGGLGALVLGVAGIIVFWKQLLIFLAGGIPLILLLFGALATYLGLEELKDSLASQKETSMEVEDYKQEIEKLKAEIEELKKSKETETSSSEQ